jgi:Tfp pilus assembly protein PilF
VGIASVLIAVEGSDSASEGYKEFLFMQCHICSGRKVCRCVLALGALLVVAGCADQASSPAADAPKQSSGPESATSGPVQPSSPAKDSPTALPTLPAASGSAAADSTPIEKIPQVTEAVARFQKLDFDGALKLLQEACQQHADLPPAEIVMAELFSQANQPAGVRIWLERAVFQVPEDPEGHVLLGDLALRDGRLAEAQLLYSRANQSLASFNRSQKRKAVLQMRSASGLAAVAEARQDWPTAEKYLREIRRQASKDAGVLQRLAVVVFQQRKADEAMEMLRLAAQIDKSMLAPEAIMARFHSQAADRENADRWMAAALKAAPKDRKVRLAAVQMALEKGALAEAKAQVAEALAIDATSPDARLLRGLVALFQKDYPAAETDFREALQASPSNFDVINNLALALCEQNDDAKKRQAQEYAETNVRQYPRAATSYATYGWVLYKAGRLEEAEQALRVAASAGTVNSETAFYVASVSVERKRTDEALQLLDAALRNSLPFLHRQEAEALRESLKKKPASKPESK